jgi:Crinkler effector protein N-terminal domain
MTIFFKLKKANASTKLAYFSEKPSWEDLTSKIARLFNIPSDRVGVAFVEKEEPITLSSEDELQGFYKYKSSEVLDLVVQDTLDPDSECTFQCLIGSYSRNSHWRLVCFPLTSPDVSQLYTFSLHSPTHSAGFRFATTPLASITSTWSQDTNLSDLFKSGTQSAAILPTNWLIIGSDDEFKLFCWVLGGFGGPFPVDIGASKTVGDLKNAIKKVKVHAFAKIDADTLNLWKVGWLLICATAWSSRLTPSRQLTEPELVDPDDTLPERMGLRGNNLMTFATRLSSGNKLSTLFPQNPLEGHLHIVVHHPSVGKSGSPVLLIDYC